MGRGVEYLYRGRGHLMTKLEIHSEESKNHLLRTVEIVRLRTV